MERHYKTIPYYQEDGNTHFGTSTAQIFYSQFGEDLEIYTCLIHPFLDHYKENQGIYIEVGAGDGVKYSNTKFFEDELNFTGILIEPGPSTHQLLKKTRPNNRLFDCAIIDGYDDIDFLIRGELDDGFVSGIPQFMPEALKESFHKHSSTIKVPGRPLRDLTSDCNIDRIDFLSIDVEGAEHEVLKSMDWTIPIYIVAVELDDEGIDDKASHQLLLQHGFVFLKKVGLSKIYFDPYFFKKLHLKH